MNDCCESCEWTQNTKWLTCPHTDEAAGLCNLPKKESERKYRHIDAVLERGILRTLTGDITGDALFILQCMFRVQLSMTEHSAVNSLGYTSPSIFTFWSKMVASGFLATKDATLTSCNWDETIRNYSKIFLHLWSDWRQKIPSWLPKSSVYLVRRRLKR